MTNAAPKYTVSELSYHERAKLDDFRNAPPETAAEREIASKQIVATQIALLTEITRDKSHDPENQPAKVAVKKDGETSEESEKKHILRIAPKLSADRSAQLNAWLDSYKEAQEAGHYTQAAPSKIETIYLMLRPEPSRCTSEQDKDLRVRLKDTTSALKAQIEQLPLGALRAETKTITTNPVAPDRNQGIGG